MSQNKNCEGDLKKLLDYRFQCEDEIKAYLGKGRIECLFCGREFKTIGTHLRTIHGVGVREYRIALNIPSKFSLSCPTTIVRRRNGGTNPAARALLKDPAIRRKAYEKNIETPRQLTEMSKQVQAANGQPQRTKWIDKKRERQWAELYDCLGDTK